MSKSKVDIPHTEELGKLKGSCSVSAQRIVETNYARGEKNMGTYLAKLGEFQTNPAYPSPRFAYAKGLADHGWAEGEKTEGVANEEAS